MTSDLTVEPLGLLATRAADGRTMAGHAIVCREADEIAFWHVDTEGAKTWAFVTTVAALRDPAEADRILSQCKQRAIVGWTATDAVHDLLAAEQAAGRPTGDWSKHAVAIPDLVAEILNVRASYRDRVKQEQQTKKNVADLEWPPTLADAPADSLDDLYRHTGYTRVVAPTAAASKALLIAGTVEWLVQQWRQTAVAVARREYLRTTFGSPAVLPPSWEAHVADAYAHHL